MDNTRRIPRVRILESDFPAKIPEDIVDSFLEVINQNGKTIALFFLYNSLHKKEFRDGLEFAHYYDNLDRSMGAFEDDEWEDLVKVCRVSDSSEIPDSYIGSYDKRNNSMYSLSSTLMSYGRLIFPYGLEESAREDYEERIDLCGGIITDDLSEGSGYEADCVDILNFYFHLREVTESLEKFRRIFYSTEVIGSFINLDFEIIGGVADNLFTKDNIDLFIDAANTAKNTIIMAFLLDYKNKHFPADGSAGLELSS